MLRERRWRELGREVGRPRAGPQEQSYRDKGRQAHDPRAQPETVAL
jgi:hypothetical protein